MRDLVEDPGGGAGADARRAGLHHLEQRVEPADATGGLHARVRADGLAHEPDVLGGRATTGEPGRGLHERGTPGDRGAARAELGLPVEGDVLLFVGRIQPLKAPDMLLKVAAELLRRDPSRRDGLTVAVVGGPSGSGLSRPHELEELAAALGISDVVRFVRLYQPASIQPVRHRPTVYQDHLPDRP